METLKVMAWFCIFVIGMFGFGTAAVLAGGAWGTVALIWLGFWMVVGILAEWANPTY